MNITNGFLYQQLIEYAQDYLGVDSMSITGSWTLKISGEKIDFREIESQIGVKATRIMRKGEIVSRVNGPSQRDFCIFERCFADQGEINRASDELLSLLKPHAEYIKGLANDLDITIKLYIQSEYAQIGILLPHGTISKLAEMAFDIELSILSWGNVKDV